MILAAFRTLILNQPSIASMINSRVYPYTIDYDTPKPAVAIRLLPSNIRSQTLLGQRTTRANVIVVDCFTLDDWSLADQIALAISSQPILGYRGVLEGVKILGVSTDGSLHHDVDGIEPASKKRICVSTVDLEVVWAI